jgi:sialidase-1
MKNLKLLFVIFTLTYISAQAQQKVEGFDKVVFHYDANRSRPQLDFRGNTKGYMTAGWWAKAQMTKNVLSWKTAIVPEKAITTFSFIGASSVLPSEITVGPKVKLTINGTYAITFNLGRTHNFTWTEGEYELKYSSRRVEFPYTSAHREFGIDGNSGIYELTVPASVVEAGKECLIEVEILPFERWHNGWFMIKDYRDVLKAATIESLQAQVDGLRRDVSGLSEQTHILATGLYSKMLGNDKFEHHIAYTDGYRHLHPADLIKLRNGEILMFTREGTEHYANDGDVIMIRSKDGGKTWGGREVVSAIQDVDEREGCGVQMKDGTIVVGIFYNDNYTPEGPYNWDGKAKMPVKGYPRLGAHFVTSKDNGKTWSAPKFMDLKGMPFKGLEGPTDAPIEMPDGSLMLAAIGYGIDGDPKNNGGVMLRSTDQGTSWKYVSTIAGDPGGKMKGFVEPGIVRTKSGRIIAGFRNHLLENAIYMTYSDDNGKTWVPVFKQK